MLWWKQCLQWIMFFTLLQTCYVMFHIRKQHFFLMWKLDKEHFGAFWESLLLTLLKIMYLYRDIWHHLIILHKRIRTWSSVKATTPHRRKISFGMPVLIKDILYSSTKNIIWGQDKLDGNVLFQKDQLHLSWQCLTCWWRFSVIQVWTCSSFFKMFHSSSKRLRWNSFKKLKQVQLPTIVALNSVWHVNAVSDGWIKCRKLDFMIWLSELQQQLAIYINLCISICIE